MKKLRIVETSGIVKMNGNGNANIIMELFLGFTGQKHAFGTLKLSLYKGMWYTFIRESCFLIHVRF